MIDRLIGEEAIKELEHHQPGNHLYEHYQESLLDEMFDRKKELKKKLVRENQSPPRARAPRKEKK
jgi:hypothetical protein